MENYVLGFAFNLEKDFVVLIEKQRPKWQAGLFNGIGGKIEGLETNTAAMVREFKEETGVETTKNDWSYVGVMRDNDWSCRLFTAADDKFMQAVTRTDEVVSVIPMYDIRAGAYGLISNLYFLIELCLDENRPRLVNIQY